MVRPLLVAAALLVSVVVRAEPVTIRYACMDGSETLPVVRAVVEAFERAHPDIRVQVEPTTDEYSMKLLTQLAAGVGPDVAWMNVALVPQFAVRGALLPLDDHLGDIRLSDYYANVVGFFRTGGKLYGLPRDVAPFGLVFYNKDLFDRAGVPYPPADWSWAYEPRDTLRERCFTWVLRELTERGADGKTTQWAFAPAWPQMFLYLLLNSRGLSLWDDNAEPTTITAADPEVVRLTEFAAEAILKHNWIPSWYQLESVAQASAYDEFVKGRIAMLATWAADAGRLRRDMANAGFRWDVALFPRFEDREPVTATDAGGTVVFAKSKHREAALAFARWMSGEPGQRAFAKTGMQPANRKLALTPGVWLPAEGAPPSQRVPANLIVADRAALAMRFDQTPEYFEETRLYLDAAAFDILSGTRPPRETMERVAREGQMRLDASRRNLPRDPFPTIPALVCGMALAAALVGWVAAPGFRERLSPRQRLDRRSAWWFLTPLVLGLGGFTLGPILFSLFLSLASADNIRPALWRGAGNYTDAFTVDPVFAKSLEVTLRYAVLSVPLNVAFALVLALLLNQNVRGIALYRACYYLPSLVSGVAASLIWLRVFNPESGILNRILYWPDGASGLLGVGGALSHWGGQPGEPINWLATESTVIPAFVLMGLWGAGGGTILFLAGLKGISETYYEAARLDGAGTWTVFRRITLPLLSPTLFFTLVTGTIGALQTFTQSFVMTQGGPNNATMFAMLHLYLQGFKSLKLGYASALAWILFAIIMVLTVIQFQVGKRWVHYEGDAR